MKTRVIFASLILGLGLVSSQANAATTTNTDDSPAATRPATAMLVNGSEKQFASYLEQHIGKATQHTNWQDFTNVVSLYNQNPAAVLTVSNADRARFNEAIAKLNTQLASRKDAQASVWLGQADHTARMINFLWNADRTASEAADIQ